LFIIINIKRARGRRIPPGVKRVPTIARNPHKQILILKIAL
jgi:hypothetical protein